MSKTLTFEGALDRLMSMGLPDLMLWQESCASCALEGNKAASKHLATLKNYLAGDIRDEEAIIKLAELIAVEMPRE